MNNMRKTVLITTMLVCISLAFIDVRFVQIIGNLYVGVVIGETAICSFKSANKWEQENNDKKAEIAGMFGIVGLPLSLIFIVMGLNAILGR